MAKESRVKKSLLNARVNLICYFISLMIAFFTRKVYLDQLGVEFIGLTSTLQSLLGFLNLAELGVGTAIGYVLYKPIFDDNRLKVNEIISVFGYIYRYIGIFILGVGVVLSMFLPWIFSNTTFSWGVIYLGFYVFLASSVLGYFVNYKQTLLSADQRNYEVTGYYQAVISVKMILQMVLAIYVQSFILYLLLELIFGIVYSIILTTRISKVYPWLKSDIKLGKKLFKKYPEIGKFVKQLFAHKIGGFIQCEITPSLIFFYVSLPMVALYGNYTLITLRMESLITGIMDSTGAGVGNLISEGNRQKIYATYKELFAVRILFAGIFSSCVYFLGSSFIAVWLGEEYELVNYIVLLIAVQFFMRVSRGTTDQFLFGYGLFYDVWAPLLEAILFVMTSMICGAYWGLAGVLCGPLLSMLVIVYIWKPYFLFSKGFRMPYILYWKIFLFHISAIILAYFISYKVSGLIVDGNELGKNWMSWIIGSLVFTIIMGIVSIIILCCISSGLRSFLHRFINLRVYGKSVK